MGCICPPRIKRLTCGPTRLMCTQGFVNLVNKRLWQPKPLDVNLTSIMLFQYLVFFLQAPAAQTKPTPAGSPAPYFCGLLRNHARIAIPPYPNRCQVIPLHAPTHPPPPPIILRRRHPHPAPTLVLPSVSDHTAGSSTAPFHSRPRPRRCPPLWFPHRGTPF